MTGETEKDCYKNLLDLEKAERAQKKKKKQAALSSSRLATQPAPLRAQQQPWRQQQQQPWRQQQQQP